LETGHASVAIPQLPDGAVDQMFQIFSTKTAVLRRAAKMP
jgi:hypothetical protein